MRGSRSESRSLAAGEAVRGCSCARSCLEEVGTGLAPEQAGLGSGVGGTFQVMEKS